MDRLLCPRCDRPFSGWFLVWDETLGRNLMYCYPCKRDITEVTVQVVAEHMAPLDPEEVV